MESTEITPSEVKRISKGLIDDIAISSTQLNEADTKYKYLLDQANKAKEKKVGLFSGKKAAIETIQEVVVEQANMINDLWEWHKKSLNHLKKLTESVHKLMFISTTSAAFTRAIIQELKNKTNGPLTKAAREQLVGVLRDLERQVDAHERINIIKNDVVNLKKDNQSHHDSVALLMGQMGRKYDREEAESNFSNVSNCLQLHRDKLEELEDKLVNVEEALEKQAKLQERLNRIKDEVGEIKKETVSQGCSITILMGNLERKYDREEATDQFSNVFNQLQMVEATLNSLKLKEDGMSVTLRETKIQCLSNKKSIFILWIVSIVAMLLSIGAILRLLI